MLNPSVACRVMPGSSIGYYCFTRAISYRVCALNGGEAMPLPAALERAIAQYNTWIDGELRKEQDASKIGDTLYHYTNVAGLEGILKSEAVWFTDFRHMNDPSEISHGIELCRDVIRLRKPGKDGRVVLFLDCLADLMRLDNFSRALEYFIGRWNPQSIIGTTRKT